MSNSKGSLELGLINHLRLKGTSGWGRQVQDGDQEKCGDKRCVADLPSPLIRAGDRDTPTNGNFLDHKGKFLSPKENVCPVARAAPASAGSQGPVAQNSMYAKEAYVGVAHSGTPPLPSTKTHMVHTPCIAYALCSV